MAPSFEIGNPQRSLVRIPGSGQDKSLKPICLDVAQIKSCARTLSVVMNFNFESPPDQPQSGTLSLSARPSFAGGLNPGNAIGNSNGNSNNRKRPIEDEGPTAKRVGIVSSPRDKFVLKHIRPPPKARRDKLDKLSAQERQERRARLRKAREALKEQNEILERKVAKFKEIILSKSKLNEFVSTLRKMDKMEVV